MTLLVPVSHQFVIASEAKQSSLDAMLGHDRVSESLWQSTHQNFTRGGAGWLRFGRHDDC
jgi:hypothetical protein